ANACMEALSAFTWKTTREPNFPTCFPEINPLPGVFWVILIFPRVDPAGSGWGASPMPMTRRELIKANAAAAAAAAVGITLPAQAADLTGISLKWSKAPCRFCGVGCGVMVGTRDNRVVATRGDPDHEVNR